MKKVILALIIVGVSLGLFPKHLHSYAVAEENVNVATIVETSSTLAFEETTPLPSTYPVSNKHKIIAEYVNALEDEEESRIYDGKKRCQIWFTQNVVAFDCETDEEIIIPKGEKLIITEDAEGTILHCNYSDKEYLVYARYALINIAEYIPQIKIELDMAKTTNYFNMKGEAIPDLTDRQFYTSESATSGDAWLRIEVAEKLYNAQEQFLSDGYSIKIYDAYRPYTCTKELSAAFKKFLDTKPQSFINDGFGYLGMGWFLAPNTSSHNYGVAVDMTLICLETGEELEMPSKMHTLDKTSARPFWPKDSVAYQNADYMYHVMKNNGFTDLQSEWWHFQDDKIQRPNSPSDISF